VMSELAKSDYGQLLVLLKEKIKQAKIRSVLTVNKELLGVYWEIGKIVLEQQNKAGWGAKIIDNLSKDLKVEFPDMQGLSTRNIKYMRAFAEAYPDFAIVQLPVAEITNKNEVKPIVQAPLAQFQVLDNQKTTIMQEQLAQLSWYHHITLLDKVRDIDIRLFYIQKTMQNGWSRNVLVHQIESELHKRQGALINNFEKTIPDYSSELTQQLFKDPYNFDFLSLGREAKERDLENALMIHVEKTLLELGDGFALMARQKTFEIGGKEYRIDLLFYHTKLHRHIVIELKIGEFEPEYISKMNMYLGIVDDQLKNETHKPSIGLILCKTKNKIVAEYALRDTTKPIGIAEYKINQLLPDDIKGDLPSIEEIEQELEVKIENAETPLKEGIDKIKSLLGNLKTEEAKLRWSPEITKKVLNEVIRPINNKTHELLKDDLLPMYDECKCILWGDRMGHHSFEALEQSLEANNYQAKEFKIDIGLNGFKKAGINAFNAWANLKFDLHEYKLTCKFDDGRNIDIASKLYHQLFTDEELNKLAIELSQKLISETTIRLEQIKV
jgi:predicted nuclease of restriction endonuclease-like (RecB) superfamily